MSTDPKARILCSPNNKVWRWSFSHAGWYAEKCSWMELQRQIIQMVFCFSASPRCSCFSGWKSKTSLYSATWKEMKKSRREINRKRKSINHLSFIMDSLKKLSRSNTFKKKCLSDWQLPVYTHRNKLLTVMVKRYCTLLKKNTDWHWLWNPHLPFFKFCEDTSAKTVIALLS